MENKKSNGHLSDSLRRKLENFPEEFPTENEWQQVRDKMMSEGLLRKKSHRKRYLLLVLLFLIVAISGLVTMPFWINKQQNNVVTNALPKAETGTSEKINPAQNKTNEEKESLKNENVKPTHEEKTTPSTVTEKPDKTRQPSQSLAKSDSQKKNTVQRTGKNVSAETTINSANTETGNQDKQISNESSASAEVKNESVTEKKEEPVTGVTNTADVRNETEVTKGAAIESQTEVVAATPMDSSVVENSSEAAPANTDSVSTVSAALPDTAKTDSTQAAVTAENKTEKEGASRRKVQLGFFVSWDSNKYYLKENNNAESSEVNYITGSDSINGKKSAEQFTVGLRGSYFLSSKLAVEAGIFYSQKRKVDAVIYVPQHSSSAGNSISDFTYHFNSKYFEVEQRIKYLIYQKKPFIYIAAGVKESFNLNQNNPDYFEHIVYTETAAPRTERVLLKPASMSLSLVLAAGLEVPLTSRSNFFFEPSYTYALDPVINNPDHIMVPVNLYRRSFSFGTGLNYKF